MSKSKGSKRRSLNALLLLTTALGGATATNALAQDQDEGVGVGDIVITATKREENLQDVPISVQALDGERLQELGITDFADYAQHLPTLSYSPSYGPGYNRPFMRGVASGENGNHSGSMPSVGTYLDEQPITTITGNLDMHLYDVSRVEVLAGPQGTLYGASSQAGTVRIITNRPDPDGFSAAWDTEFSGTRFGGFSQTGEGYVNIPLSSRAAVRIVGWAEHDGGYIDNRVGSRTYPSCDFDTDPGPGTVFDCMPVGITDENSDVAKEDYNTVNSWGGRVALGIDITDSWTITPQIMGQRQNSNGVFAEQSDVGDLGVTHFFPEWNKDDWIQGALTIEGEIGNFDVVFAASRLSRDVDSNQDYSDYGFFYDVLLGYGCYYVDNAGVGSACDTFTGGQRLGNPINPGQQVEGRDHYDRETYEFRITSPANSRIRAIAGIFYQLAEHEIHQRYYFSEDFRDAYEVTGWPDTIWLTEQTRTDEEKAIFGEVAFDILNSLTATVGVRAFETENSLYGFFGFGAGFSGSTGEAACFLPLTPFRGAPCTNLDESTTEDGQLYRANLEWNIDEDRMVYATYSEGFRPGGINRRATQPPYQADFLDNYEFGWKTQWADGRLRWNGAIFHEVWEDFQFAFLGLSGLTEIQNAGDAEINGIETDITLAPIRGLVINAAVTVLESELTSAAIPDTTVGTSLPVAPDVKFDMTTRYEFPLGNWEAFLQGGVSYVGNRSIDIRNTEAGIIGELSDYWTADFSAGIEQNGLNLSLFIDNIFDERGITGRYTECAIQTCGGVQYNVVNRPLTAGIRIGRRY